jgi:hypothetical protein
MSATVRCVGSAEDQPLFDGTEPCGWTGPLSRGAERFLTADQILEFLAGEHCPNCGGGVELVKAVDG